MRLARRAYFFCREADRAFHDDVVVLAEGLLAEGFAVFGNFPYWRDGPELDRCLIRFDPNVRPCECDVVIVSYVWARWIDTEFRVHSSDLPGGLFDVERKYRTAYLDLDDGYRTCSWAPEYREFDVVFRAKYNVRCFQPRNHVPWAIGIQSRVLRATGQQLAWRDRQKMLLVNFNASHPYRHAARALMDEKFIPAARRLFRLDATRDDLSRPPEDAYERLMWEQTGHRHCQAYFDRLGRSQAIAAFCGELIPPHPNEPDYLVGGRRAKLRRLFFRLVGAVSVDPPRLIQWDSWRFWEGLAAGCLVFNLDLEYYGVRLPVMPVNWVHYVGVRADNVEEVISRLREEPELAETIAQKGRAWAVEHYAPRATARRFITAMGL